MRRSAQRRTRVYYGLITSSETQQARPLTTTPDLPSPSRSLPQVVGRGFSSLFSSAASVPAAIEVRRPVGD